VTFQTTYTPELADRICELVETGTPLSRVCKMEGFPTAGTVYRWLRVYPEFEENYSRSKRTQLEMLAEEMLEIADDESQDRGNSTKVNRDRVKIDTRKFLLERLLPEKFGNKMRNEISGPNGGPVASVEVDKEQLARYVAFLSSKKEES
jgi:hypothetical protein